MNVSRHRKYAKLASDGPFLFRVVRLRSLTTDKGVLLSPSGRQTAMPTERGISHVRLSHYLGFCVFIAGDVAWVTLTALARLTSPGGAEMEDNVINHQFAPHLSVDTFGNHTVLFGNTIPAAHKT